MYVVLIFSLVILSGISNAIMDTWAFHYPDSKLKKWGQKWPRFQRFSGPDSWKNKNRFTGLWGYLMRTVFSFSSDLWHLSQFAMLTALQILIAWHCPDLVGRVGEICFQMGFYVRFPFWVNVLIWVGIQKMIFGIVFEVVFSWLGNRLGKKKCKRCESLISSDEFRQASGLCRDCWASQFLKNIYDNPFFNDIED